MKILDKSGHFRASTAGMVVFRSNAPGLGSPKALVVLKFMQCRL